jgi:NCAIR mutase (PurE)-related protein
VIYCEGKPDEYLKNIFLKIYETNGEVFGTRASEGQYELIKEVIPQISYDKISRILKYEKPDKERTGMIAVCTAGTADIPVAEEAAQTAEYFGSNVTRIFDVGVSGLHRLLSKLELIQSANCVIAVAGMEGALASVIGGLVSNPVIAVPTSVGYGTGKGGFSALLTMINSCANGIAVVNIDNGYGAGYMATQINRLATKI